MAASDATPPGASGERDLWSRADALFMELLDEDEETRLGRLERAEAEDPALARAVRALFVSADAADGLLWGAAARARDRVARAMEESEALAGGDMAGGTVGPYRLLRPLARGGMGTVYLAEREGPGYRQRVALKVLRRGLDTDDFLRRFRLERRILASLTHANIAHLLEGGSTDDGRPWLAMEYVDGEPIDRWCDDRRLGVRERLRMFIVVGRAVQHAHAHLVVHRDLKPSNILVTADGVVKLLDFGIAKLLDDPDHPDGAPLTRTGLRLLTPEYASPEQAQGLPVSTASDVYQLGLLLHDLLCGRETRRAAATAPGDTGGAAITRRMSSALARAAQTGATRIGTPSAAPGDTSAERVALARGTTLPRLRRDLQGDLDNVVLMALRPEPERRYESVAQLVEDVAHHLDGRPVLARGDSLGYRARTFLRRHRAAAAGVALAVLVLLASSAALAVQARRLARERDLSREHAARAEAVSGFLLSLFETSDTSIAWRQATTARDLVERGADRLEGELEGQPALRAELSSAVGQILRNLGSYERAEALLSQAVAQREALGEPSAALATDLTRIADLLRQSDRDSALALRRRALAIAEEVAGPDDPLVARMLVGLATDKSSLAPLGGRYRALEAEVGPDLDRAIRILRAHPGDVRLELARALQARSHLEPGPEKIRTMREALELRRAVLGEDHTEVAGNENDLALALERVDPPASDSLMRQAAETYARVLGPDHPETLTILNNLAGIRRDRGECGGAVPLYEQVLEIRRTRYPELGIPLAYTTYGLGVCRLELGDPVAAEALLSETGTLLEESPYLLQITRLALARALVEQGDLPGAERELLAAEAWLAENADAGAAVPTLEALAALYQRWGRDEEAARYRRRLAEAGEPPP